MVTNYRGDIGTLPIDTIKILVTFDLGALTDMKFLHHTFINIDLYAGRFLDEWNLNPKIDDIDYGASLSLGALTIVGPIKVIFSTGTVNSFQAELQIGYQF